MTERGLPLADGAPACPFVALDDDRDERSSVPDHRHRCFAEPTPAPRALAHQEAYCLSSAFPVCPTFQDWARREAARSRDGGKSAAPAAQVPRSTDRGPVDPAIVGSDLAAAASAAAGLAGTAGGGGTGREDRSADAARRDERGGRREDRWGRRDDELEEQAATAPPPPLGVEGDPEPDEDDDAVDEGASAPRRPDEARRNPPRDWAAPPPWLASAEGRRRDDDAEPPSFLGRRAEPGQGLAGSAADRMAGGDSWDRGGASASAAGAAGGAAAGAAAGASAAASGGAPSTHDEEEWTSSARPSGRAAPRPRADTYEIEELGDEDEPPRRSTKRPRAYGQHLGGPDGPDWERPRRYEAYPTIRSRGLPRVPPIALMALAIGALAIALFLLPGILNIGGTGGAGAGASSSAAASAAAPSVSAAPSVAAAPTPELYTIKKGDTLSKVAKAHGVTLEELLAANPAIKNPNRVGEGQQIVIPTPSEAPPDTVGESAAP